jgi:hypothetical protein
MDVQSSVPQEVAGAVRSVASVESFTPGVRWVGVALLAGTAFLMAAWLLLSFGFFFGFIIPVFLSF